MRFGLTGEEDSDNKADIQAKLISQLIHERTSILVLLVRHLVDIEFEVPCVLIDVPVKCLFAQA